MKVLVCMPDHDTVPASGGWHVQGTEVGLSDGQVFSPVLHTRRSSGT